MAEKGEKGFLADVFNTRTLLKFALWSIPAFFIFGYVDNMIFDPFFFEPIHTSYGDPDITAWKALLHDKLGWMHDFSGFMGGEGVLQSDFMQAQLEPYKKTLDVAAGYTPTGAETPVSDIPANTTPLSPEGTSQPAFMLPSPNA